MNSYQNLEERFHRLLALREASAMLEWDQSTMMPDGGRRARSEQLATLAVLGHEMLTEKKVEDLLGKAQEEPLSAWQAANLHEMRRAYIHATALDGAFVEAYAKARSVCEATWREARPSSDFKQVLPSLEALLKLVREAASRKAEKLDCSPYEALMDEFEPGLKTADVDAIFADYAKFLPGFLGEVLDHQARQPQAIPPKGPFPISKQREMGQKIMANLGFDFDHGRLDTSLHPFCGGVPEDVRITTRYTENEFVMALMGIIHETGHALYERGLPQEWRLQLVGLARGMAMHESQSLLMEMQASRSKAFLEFLSPLLRKTFPGNDAAFASDNLIRLYTKVQPGFIRVDADEVTYPAHIILRYRLEQALVKGDLPLADLPMAWNNGMKELLGLDVPEDRLGCLQDIHWFDGAFGYFPCYSLGAMIAAQLFDAAKRANANLLAGIQKGDFLELRNWLKANIHEKASSHSTQEIVAMASGQKLNPEIFKKHLRERYLGQ